VTPALIMRATKTAGWQIVYRAASGHEYVLDRRLTPDAARATVTSAQSVYRVVVEVDQ
jgi:hypothetical protein